MNKTYKSTKTLRYGSLMIMADQDHDGSHIKGLIINFVHHFWPDLIKCNTFLKEQGSKNQCFPTADGRAGPTNIMTIGLCPTSPRMPAPTYANVAVAPPAPYLIPLIT